MNVFEQHVSWSLLLLANDSNTQRFEMSKTTFIDNESSNNYEMYMDRGLVLYTSVIIRM